MTPSRPLYLHEEILLLAFRNKKGTLAAEETKFQHALGGAILAELLLQGRAGVEEERRKKFVALRNRRPLGEPVLDEALTKLRDAKRRASLKTWVMRFAGMKRLRHRVARQLCRRGILRADEDKVLLIFTRKIYPELDPRPERALVERLRAAIFADTGDVDARTAILVSLADKTGLLKLAFDRKDLKARKARIASLAAGEAVGQAAKAATDAAQAAILVAVIAP
ncbi:MAG: GPP34 family phosphoprotein [Candidatus Krumholzibacteriota bacterium]|nr:GPP34 family phosphoprotein [Candidatus Krumholzibacteriota bacterium]